MRILGFSLRIIRQLLRDKRTLALMFMAPILILTLLSLIFDSEDYEPKVGYVLSSAQNGFSIPDRWEDYSEEAKATTAMKEGTIDGFVDFTEPNNPSITVEGSDPTINGAVLKEIQTALTKDNQATLSEEVHYLYGQQEMGLFDSFGPILLGFFIFFFVFLVSGVSFLRERTSGTLERLLASPLRIWEMVVSYVIGFGIITILQASFISWFSIYILDMMMKGAFIHLLMIIVTLSFSALTLGILLSSFAKNELQMMQFIPIVVVPQIFFSGLFNLDTISDWLSWIGRVTPLYYAADALRDVMIRGLSLSEIAVPLLILLGFSILFVLLNIAALKKYRKI
ncbi:ABC-2 type transport system permease protein [Bacillus pakistanensis]|uniref:ABC-2 type transport system permease protein n=1 Tax=Rossellomorea pakistanensis TaxID=992288 RepID=A0ABS2NBE3_9BACI|nr:ABC transporter permease [Bacillus pakistanensis]MBM7585179.1 ABC-2 type transport system permease protein [Bacillus pakistanensis]